MKKATVFLFVLLVLLRASDAQDVVSTIESFRSKVLPDFGDYFASAELTAKGQLSLSASPAYARLSAKKKKFVMDQLVYAWRRSLVLVQFESQRELWTWDGVSSQAALLDTWDRDTATAAIAPAAGGTGTSDHPWFYYAGGMFNLDSLKNLTTTVSTSVGFFLLKNRWDLAATVSSSVMTNTESETSTSLVSFGLQSKVYFPLGRNPISPFVGGEVALTITVTDETSSTTFTPAALAGVSWFLGSGSLDLSVRIKKHPAVMVGYTFRP
jgi:hypothetical protein